MQMDDIKVSSVGGTRTDLSHSIKRRLAARLHGRRQSILPPTHLLAVY